jgi:hypothetical protein
LSPRGARGTKAKRRTLASLPISPPLPAGLACGALQGEQALVPLYT